MIATKAKEALLSAVNNIAEEANAASLKTTIKCTYGDVDLNEHDEWCENARILFAELYVMHEGVKDAIIYECAVGIVNGEVADEELASRISKMRASVRELVSTIKDAENPEEEFRAQIVSIDGEEEEIDAPAHDNKKFYIVTGVAAAVLILLLLLVGKLF